MPEENLQKEYEQANAAAIKACLDGSDSGSASGASGARVAFNIPAVHVPAFVTASRQGDPRAYKNTYDLDQQRIGDKAPKKTSETREMVDRALPPPTGDSPHNTYFGAVELNGSGVRFYGDFCLLLKSDRVRADTVILNRNSYDLVRSPIRERVEDAVAHGTDKAEALATEARELSGTWGDNLAEVAAAKVLGPHPNHVRRLTAGCISGGVLTDEDYIEVLKRYSFNVEDVRTVRTHSHDAAREALIGNRLRTGPCPDVASLIWQSRRRNAERSLREEGLFVEVVTTTGRVKS